MAQRGSVYYQNENLHSSTHSKDSTESKHKKFRVFKDLELKREMSIEKKNKIVKNEEIFWSEHKRTTSQNSIKSGHTPRKVPHTPRKHLESETNKEKLTVKNILEKFKQIVIDFQGIIDEIRKYYCQVIKKIRKEIQQNCKKFIHAQINIITPSDINSSYHFDDNKIASEKLVRRKTEQQRSISELKIQKKLAISEIMNNGDRKNFNDPQKKSKGNKFFSAMIKLRESIRNDVTGAVTKKNESPVEKGPQISYSSYQSRLMDNGLRTGRIQRKSPSIASQEKQQMAKSIQKFQQKLTSLKNILSQ